MFRASIHELFLERKQALIPWLDFLRSLAILLVIGGHCLEFGFRGPAAKLLYWGWTGVDLFFVLSGYLIGRQLWKEIKTTGSIDVTRFILRRGLRIWPLYYATILAYLAGLLASHQSLRPLLADGSFTSNYLHSAVKGGWSLSTEEQFYIAVPLVLLICRRALHRNLVWVPILWLIALPALRYRALAHAPGVAPGLIIYTPFHLHSDGLAAGLLLAWVAIFCPQWWRSKKDAMGIPLLLIAAGVALRFEGKDICSYTALALIYTGLALFGLRASYANRLTTWRGIHVVSRLSYGAYLNHLVIIESIAVFASRPLQTLTNSPLALTAVFLGITLLSLGLAFVTFTLIERPALLWRDRILNNENKSGSSAESSFSSKETVSLTQ